MKSIKNTINLILCITLLFSCNQVEKNSRVVLKSQANYEEELSNNLQEPDTTNLRPIENPIDSNMLIKAFDDIYFGDKKVGSKEIFYLNNISYSLFSAKYSDLGLSYFSLLSPDPYYESSYGVIKEEVLKTISNKYSYGKKCFLRRDGTIDRHYEKLGDEDMYQQKDKYDVVFEHKWEKDGIVIFFGYQTFYYKNNHPTSEKLYKPMLQFEYTPYLNSEKKQNDSIINWESNKF